MTIFGLTLNELGNVYGEGNISLIKEAIAKLKAAGKYVGLSTGEISYEKLKYWSDMGIDMLSTGSDYGFMKQAAVEVRETLEKAHKFNK